MPTFLGSARSDVREPHAAALRQPPPAADDHVFGVFLRESGQGEVELDFRERCIQFLLFHLLRVFVPDDLRNKPLARCESEVVVQVLVAGDVDLRRQVTMSRRRYEEMDVCRSLPMTAKLVQQALGRSVGRTAVSGGMMVRNS